MTIIQKLVVALILVAGLSTAALSQPSGEIVETRHLIASDASGSLSDHELKTFAEQTQAMLERILEFWSADSGIDRLGKIRIIFDAPRKDSYSSVFFWEKQGDKQIRIVRVYGSDEKPQMLAHKLTSAVFPQKDKLIRNMMGILTEAQIGNPLTFPRCGFDSDEWVLSFLAEKSFIPVKELGPDHESWGMSDSGGGKLKFFNRAKQHKAYAEAGSLGNYLFKTYGIDKIKQFHRLSREKDRPWQEVFGIGLQELESSWLASLKVSEKEKAANISMISTWIGKDPLSACAEAQRHVTRQ